MKLLRPKVRFKRLPQRDYFLLYPVDTPAPFWVDLRFLQRLITVRWRFVAAKQRARGFFSKGTRQYLHRYVLNLANKYYPEVTFANGDPFDCRLVNLKPYRRDEDGARRKLFKNSTSRRKGVCFHKAHKKWAAMIRVHGKLRHLGYFSTADQAARAYEIAYALAHPNKPTSVFGRTGST